MSAPPSLIPVHTSHLEDLIRADLAVTNHHVIEVTHKSEIVETLRVFTGFIGDNETSADRLTFTEDQRVLDPNRFADGFTRIKRRRGDVFFVGSVTTSQLFPPTDRQRAQMARIIACHIGLAKLLAFA